MAQDPLSLAKLIASRICHDLISPVGAIANGMELVALTGADSTPEFELISDSVAGANARIKFYRVALGMSSAEQKLGRSEISTILGAFYKGTRLTCAWDVQDDCPRTEVQAAFLALLCVAAHCQREGSLPLSVMMTPGISSLRPIWCAQMKRYGLLSQAVLPLKP